MLRRNLHHHYRRLNRPDTRTQESPGGFLQQGYATNACSSNIC